MVRKQCMKRFICIMILLLFFGVLIPQYISVDFFSKKAEIIQPQITILNIQSYPKVGSYWTVYFEVEGTADLIIEPIDGTTWSFEDAVNCDIIFQHLKTEDNLVPYIWENQKLIIKNFSSAKPILEVSKVRTLGKHTLQFSFGDDVVYAFNDASNWWNNYWGYRKKITINHSQISADLVNFPIMINVTDTNLKDHAQDDGGDIAFVSFLDNATTYAHEIETYNDANGQLIAWVNITQLSSSQDTYFWMYYGNNNCSNRQTPTQVWNSNYKLIHHFNESSNPHNDSTIYSNHGNESGGVDQSISGIIDGANRFDGIDDYVLINDSTSLDMVSEITVEAWINLDTVKDGMIIDKENAYRLWFDYYGDQHWNNFVFEIWNGSGWEQKLETLYWSTGAYYYFAGTYNGTDIHGYLNGSQISNSVDYIGNIASSINDVYIGAFEYGGYNFSGIIDEIRISNTALNQSWINTSYNTIINHSLFVSFGTEESAGPFISDPYPLDGDMSMPNTPSYFEITVYDPNPDMMNITWRTNASGTWKNFNVTDGGGVGIADGAYQVNNTSWASQYNQLYWWSANVTDGTHWTNQTFQFTLHQYMPKINSFLLSDANGNKLNNQTGNLIVQNTYYFLINVTDNNGWNDVDFINISCWFDQGDDSTALYYNQTEGGNINMFLQYKNTSGVGIFQAIWPKDEIEFSHDNCSENIINDTTRIINISFQPGNQFRYAVSNNTWNTTSDSYNDIYSWNVNCTVNDSGNNNGSIIDEFGVNWNSTITATEKVDISGAPGMIAQSSIMTITYSCNSNYHLFVYMVKNFTQLGGSDIIDVAGNLNMLEDADLNDELTINTTFSGVGENHVVTLFNTSAPVSGTIDTVDVQFELLIPFGTWGVYSSNVVKKINRNE
jgi:concanavalin A-like lectin/glucanase superfamily protein/uncharacterized protein DUF2341